jgi:2,3-bisphosphoglycerate-independent phosphoglycerate mutase
MKPVVLVICDGWGWREETFGNAIAQARTPNFDDLQSKFPWTTVLASGEAVGLPPGQQGNSEVGHLTIGSGRVILQPLSRIDQAIVDGSFFENPVLCQVIDETKARGGTLHCLGLVSPGGVHSHQSHAVALARLAAQRGLNQTKFHAFTDGRDEPPTSAAEFVAQFDRDIADTGAQIVTLAGRYYAMDRDSRWERLEMAKQVIVGKGPSSNLSPQAYVEARYKEGETDEFIAPTRFGDYSGVNSADAFVFWNFRPDRARQLTYALLQGECADNPFVTFTQYDKSLPARVAFETKDVNNTLAEVVSRAGAPQVHIAETEKYAHVTYFINGGREEPFGDETRKLISSPRISTYDLQPRMSADAITDEVVAQIATEDPKLVVVNFANADMVGHTGVFDATITAVECIDGCVGRICEAAEEHGYAVVITSDHGNAENKIDPSDNSPLTAHTIAPVPLIIRDAAAGELRSGGALSDVAPTVLEVMGVPVPSEMTGRSLLVD